MDMVISPKVKRFDVCNVGLNPTQGSEINKIHPCLIVSPDQINNYLNTVVIVPLTSTFKPYPTRLNCVFKDRKGQLAIDQIRSIDKSRIIEMMGKMDEKTSQKVCDLISEMFKYD